MKRNFSAKSTGLKLPTKVLQNSHLSDIEKINNLKSRLFERGISQNPLPSVRKPIVSHSSQKLQTVPRIKKLRVHHQIQKREKPTNPNTMSKNESILVPICRVFLIQKPKIRKSHKIAKSMQNNHSKK